MTKFWLETAINKYGVQSRLKPRRELTSIFAVILTWKLTHTGLVAPAVHDEVSHDQLILDGVAPAHL